MICFIIIKIIENWVATVSAASAEVFNEGKTFSKV